MSWAFFQASDIKHTRKEHECLICGRKIPVGKPAYNWRGLYDGDFQNSYACRFCYENHIGMHSEEISECEFNDWLYEQDFMKCHECEDRYSQDWNWVNGCEDIEIECECCDAPPRTVHIGWAESEVEE
jgi:hypothetical protein